MGNSQSEKPILHQEPILLRHSNDVLAVAFSPDGERIATGSADSNARIWSASNGKILHTLRSHTNRRVCGVAWSPLGELLMTGSEDGTACIWRSKNGELLATLKSHMILFGVAWSPTDEIVATAGYGGGTAKLWRASTGELLQTTERNSFGAAVIAVAFFPSGMFLITGNGDSTAKIFPVTAQNSTQPTKPLHTLRGHSDAVRAVACSPRGNLIATGSFDKTVRLWDANTCDTIRILTGHSNWISGVAWSLTGDFIISGCADGTAIIWDTATGDALQTLTHHSEWINAVAWSPRGDHIATGSDDSTAKIVPITLPTKEEKAMDNDTDDAGYKPANHPSQQGKNATNDSNDHSKQSPNSPNDSNLAIPSPRRPPSRCFKRSKQLSFQHALTKLLQLRDLPKDRPDLENYIPDDDDIKTTLTEVDEKYKDVQRRPKAKKLIQDHGLSIDEVKAIICYTINHPYKVYMWFNAWLMTSRRDDKVVDHVGPFFLLLYRGMEKLPCSKVQATRGVLIRDIEVLCITFDDYENQCKKGSSLSFWGIASFSTKDQVAVEFAEDDEDDAIVYTCGDLECVSIREFSDFPDEDEVVPLPPAIFEVNSALKVGKKLIIAMDQKDHHDVAYVTPKVSKKK